MPWADLAIIIIMLVSIGYGLSRGGLYELFNLITWLVAFFLAYTYRTPVANRLDNYIQDELIGSTISFGIVFLIGYIVASLVISIIYRLVQQGLPGPADRLFGLILGVIRGWVLIVIGLFLIDLIGIQGSILNPSDALAALFNPGTSWLDARLPAFLEWVNVGSDTVPELPKVE